MIIGTTEGMGTLLNPSVSTDVPIRIVSRTSCEQVASDIALGHCDIGALPGDLAEPLPPELTAAMALRPTAAVWLSESRHWTLVASGSHVLPKSAFAPKSTTFPRTARRYWLHAWARNFSTLLDYRVPIRRAELVGIHERLFLGSLRSNRVAQLSDFVTLSPAVLTKLLNRRGLRGPKRLIMIGNGFRAWELSRAGAHTMEQIAHLLNFASASSFSKSMRSALNRAPTELMLLDPSDLLQRLVAALAKEKYQKRQKAVEKD